MKREKGHLSWWQLSLLGVACIIGTGYFLGSSLAIKKAGPAVLISFLLAAVGTYIVFDALARMTAEHPEKGSFRSYAKKAYGPWAGFSNGWVYWSSELLIMGSQLTALSIFSRFWFPNLPLWILSSFYAVIGLIIILTGLRGFERVENIFAIVKIAAIVMFICIASAALLGWLNGGPKQTTQNVFKDFLPTGLKGIWTSFLYAFYAFGGIEVMGLLATQLKEPKQAPKSGRMMLVILTIIYVTSLILSLLLVPWKTFSTKESPFVTALQDYDLSFVPHVFNAILIIAGFSTMVAALYAVITMLVNLSEDGDAPKFLSKKGKLKVPLPAFLITAVGLVLSIIVALLLPESIYEYLTTAAGLMLLYTWMFILLSFRKLIQQSFWDTCKFFLGILLILAAVSGTVIESSSRWGFFVSLIFLFLIGIFSLIHSKKKKKKSPEEGTLFSKIF
ncbi:amino acid permease [Bacillus timonensis]|nr:amino acid permease [Bacillus timonensis]